MALKISTDDGQEIMLFLNTEQHRQQGPWYVTGHYPFVAIQDLEMDYQGNAEGILNDVLGRIESCVMQGGTITYVPDEEVPQEDRPFGLKVASAQA